MANLVEDSLDDGEQSGVIGVSVSFRVGVMGHLASSTLKSRSGDGSAGSWGIQDQRESLRWVRDNIASFGGDPDNVLIFGHSSGGGSVSAHMVMPPSFSLFHKAIIHSGSFSNWAMHSWEAAEHNYRAVAVAAGCATGALSYPASGEGDAEDISADDAVMECLLSKSWDEIQIAASDDHVPGGTGVPCRDGCAWAPVVDGEGGEFPRFHWQLARDGRRWPGGREGRVGERWSGPLIQSTTFDDGASYSYMPADGGDAELRRYFSLMFGDEHVERLLALYPPEQYSAEATTAHEGVPPHSLAAGYTAGYWAAGREETDFAYRCTKRWASRWFSADQADPPVFQIQFAYGYDRHTHEVSPGIPVKHGAELDFIFSRAVSPDDDNEPDELADLLVGYWCNFARTGDPNRGLAHPRVGGKPYSTDPSGVLYWPRTYGDGGPPDPDGEMPLGSAVGDYELHVSGADIDGCGGGGGGGGECDIVVLTDYHDEQCDWWARHWQPMDGSYRAGEQVGFGGCVPCWKRPRPDASAFGPVPTDEGC
jgi:hypothetical protein